MAILSAGLNLPVGGQQQYEFYSGGTSYWVNIFTTSGTLYVPQAKTGAVILLVGGGGSGGGAYGNNDTGKGGGGAGGAVIHTNYSLNAGNYPIVVGIGGRGRYKVRDSGDDAAMATNCGSDSYAFSVIARGGGQGGASDNHIRGCSGGCGGGGGARNGNGGWNDGRPSVQESYSGWTSYGNSGGGSGSGNRSGGGGGGIGGAGSSDNNQANGSGSQGGAGGAGRDFSSYFGWWSELA